MVKKKQFNTKQKNFKYSKNELNNIRIKFLLFFFSNISNSSIALTQSNSKLISFNIFNNCYFNQQSLQSKTNISRNCLLTGRSRANYRSLGISRCMLKDLISKGQISGYKRAIW